MTIQSIEDIKEDLFLQKRQALNFSIAVNFPFSSLYLDIVTQIPIIEISAECVLLNSVVAWNDTREFRSPDYWAKNCSESDRENYWFFAQNGQGDYWLFDTNEQVYFFDHNQGELSQKHFLALDMNFQQWLQFAYLNKQLEGFYDVNKGILPKSVKQEYKNLLSQLSPNFADNYPFYL